MSDLTKHSPPQMTAGLARHERPIWIWDRATAHFVWANSAGVKFWSATSLERLQSMECGISHPAFKASAAALDDDTPERGIDVDLDFPNGSGTYRYRTLCRHGQLQERSAIIIEVKGARSSTSLEEADEQNTNVTVDEVKSPAPIPASSLTVNDASASKKSAAPSQENSGVSDDSLNELARLIKEAGADSASVADDQDLRITPELKDNDAGTAAAFFDGLSLDIAALIGAADGAEIEALIDQCGEPLALISQQRMIHANEPFASEFGYGDVGSLLGDGTDWILPHARDGISALLNGSAVSTPPAIWRGVRLCSGRKMARDVYVKPVRLTRFDRALLLLGVDENFADISRDGASRKPSSIDVQTDVPLSGQTVKEDIGIEEITGIPLLSAISHEVRTPLNVIIGFSEIMAREEFGPIGVPGHKGGAKYKDYVQDIHKSALHALSLINDLLDLTKLQAGKWEIEREPLVLNEVVRGQVHLMRELAAQQNVKLRSVMEENLPSLLLDRRAVEQILLNLISNAIKFTPEGGSITVTTEERTGGVALIIEDSGHGMSETEVARSMEPFQQIGSKMMTARMPGGMNGGTAGDPISPQGTGLGLTIAKALAFANDMSFEITSEKGSGTVITMIIKD